MSLSLVGLLFLLRGAFLFQRLLRLLFVGLLLIHAFAHGKLLIALIAHCGRGLRYTIRGSQAKSGIRNRGAQCPTEKSYSILLGAGPRKTGAPLTVIDDRFPGIFELRRLFYPKFEALADPARIDQGIGGFLDHVQKPNFAAFADQAAALSGHPVIQIERVGDNGTVSLLDDAPISSVDTIVVISFDSLRTHQAASAAEIGAVQHFLSNPDHLIVVCPHHDIGATSEPVEQARLARQTADHFHHGDKAIPPRQGFGGFARTLLAGLGVPVVNRFGLRPAVRASTLSCNPAPRLSLAHCSSATPRCGSLLQAAKTASDDFGRIWCSARAVAQ
jgi:hypothetical protein